MSPLVFMTKPYSKIKWYPPAETKVPLAHILKSFSGCESEAESELGAFTGARYSVFGSNAKTLLFRLLASLRAKAVDDKDEVLIPGYTCYSVPASVVKAGLKIRLYDLNPRTLAPVEETIRQRCTKKTLAVITQHLFGLVCDVSNVGEIAHCAEAYHIEDAAQGFGGSIGERAVGTVGDFGLFSFGRGKPLPIGGGGALISNKFDLSDFAESRHKTRGYGHLFITAATQMMARPDLYWIAEALPLGLGKTVFDPGFNVKSVSECFRGLFVQNIKTLQKAITRRERIAAIYRRNLPECQTVLEDPGVASVYNRFPLAFGKQPIPQGLIRLGVRRMYPFSVGKEASIRPFLKNRTDQTPGADSVSENIVTLPTHHAITDDLAYAIAQMAIENSIQN